MPAAQFRTAFDWLSGFFLRSGWTGNGAVECPRVTQWCSITRNTSFVGIYISNTSDTSEEIHGRQVMCK